MSIECSFPHSMYLIQAYPKSCCFCCCSSFGDNRLVSYCGCPNFQLRTRTCPTSTHTCMYPPIQNATSDIGLMCKVLLHRAPRPLITPQINADFRGPQSRSIHSGLVLFR
ncbi:hypothetical protein SCLCIDRAFT_974924 [Scleroderma citrinum Foug A]|uniref:Uncharacterized protein n=1 Tax=Scleroderma citrinum Foug A TaxID=1036808 RepID=A0A0C3A5I7_9AGAM|nr:hypothetical protein SCLCIDRAFT_974924 [Scleroderma citrinum Foug A]